MADHRFCFIIALFYQIICTTFAINIAVNKPTRQSSTYDGAGTAVSSRAVDGNTNGNFNQDSCTHTLEGTAVSPSWWCVYLQAVYNNISYIKVHNRVASQDRLKGFIIKTSSSGQCDESGFTSATPCFTDTSRTSQDVHTITTCNQASTIFISVPDFLTLCEVKVITECPNCNNKACNEDSGVCTDGCIPGYTGNTCDTACSINCQPGGCNQLDGRCNRCKVNTVGDFCNETCNIGCQSTKELSTCHRSGTCTSGCIGGKSGEYCSIDCNTNCIVCKQDDINSCSECKDRRWGRSCSKLCSTNCQTVESIDVCTVNNGWCHRGCVAGKMGLNCSEDCSNGFYGTNCNSICGFCAKRTSCEVIRGSCGQVGCIEGYTGPTCHIVEVEEGISPSVTGIIGFICGILVMVILVVLIYIFYYKRRWTRKPTTGTARGVAYENRSGSGTVTNIPGEYETFDGEATTANSPASTNIGVSVTGTSTETTYDRLDMTKVTDHQPDTYSSLVKHKDYINYPNTSKLDKIYVNE